MTLPSRERARVAALEIDRFFYLWYEADGDHLLMPMANMADCPLGHLLLHSLTLWCLQEHAMTLHKGKIRAEACLTYGLLHTQVFPWPCNEKIRAFAKCRQETSGLVKQMRGAATSAFCACCVFACQQVHRIQDSRPRKRSTTCEDLPLLVRHLRVTVARCGT